MSRYVISAVGTAEAGNAPREYDSQYGKMIAYKLKLEGVNDIVEMSRKADSPAPKAGDELIGTIEKTQYGHKFKAERPQNSFKSQPKDEAGIKAMWAIGQAVQLHSAVTRNGGEEAQGIEATAKELFAMVDRVKGSTVVTEPKVQDVVADIPETVDLSDIPF